MTDDPALPAVCVTVDLDALRCYCAIHGLPAPAPGPDPILRAALPRMLEDFAQAKVKATLFCVGQDLDDPEVVALLREAVAQGHELANHTWSHFYDLRIRGEAVMESELARVEEALHERVGVRPVGFRTPGYNLSPALLQVVARRGYRYDSSLLPCPSYYAAKGAVMAWGVTKGEPSRSQMALPETLLAPLAPYRASLARPWRRAGPTPEPWLWEVPMAAIPWLGFPVIGTTLHLLGARGFERAVPALKRTSPQLLQLEFHAIDWVDAWDVGLPQALAARQPDLRVPLVQKRTTYAQVFSQALRFWGQAPTLARAVEVLHDRAKR